MESLNSTVGERLRGINLTKQTKLRQKVRRFCFNVLQAFALKMRKLPRLSDVGCFPNCCSAFLRLLMASLQVFSCTAVRTGTSQHIGQSRQFPHLQGESLKNIETKSAHFLA
jgi:hypothetical protein